MRVSNRRYGWLLVAVVLTLALAACQSSTPAASSTPTAAAVVGTPSPTVDISGLGLGLNPTESGGTPTITPTPIVITLEGAKTTASGLQYLEETAGQGEAPKKGELITMNYIASLPDGTEMINTYTRGQTVTAVWGADRLLPGWEEGIGLMKVGTKAKMVLPPALAFGAQGNGSIPPNTQIILEVELMKTEATPVPTEVA